MCLLELTWNYIFFNYGFNGRPYKASKLTIIIKIASHWGFSSGGPSWTSNSFVTPELSLSQLWARRKCIAFAANAIKLSDHEIRLSISWKFNIQSRCNVSDKSCGDGPCGRADDITSASLFLLYWLIFIVVILRKFSIFMIQMIFSASLHDVAWWMGGF